MLRSASTRRASIALKRFHRTATNRRMYERGNIGVHIAVSLQLAVFMTAGACAHIELPAPPPPDAPRVERDAYYQRLRPLGIAVGDVRAVTLVPIGGIPVWIANGGRSIRHIKLADGHEVIWSADLLPLVDPTSATGRRATDEVALQDATMRWGIASAAVGTAGALAGLTGLALLLPFTSDPANGQPWLIAAGVVGGAGAAAFAAGLGLLTPTLLSSIWRDEARLDAFTSYDADLRVRLGLDASAPTSTAPRRE